MQLKHNKKKKSNKTSIEKDFDKFRHEIYKFGLTGLEKKEQLDARVELAIKLGAKPKKWIKPNTGLGADNKQKQSSQTKTTTTTAAPPTTTTKLQNGKTRKAN